ncbi:MAG: hypothetical protein QM744_02510 [Mesorhizobium sp.]
MAPARPGAFPQMVAAGVNIQLGTDGNNNGNAADMMRAMFASAGLFKDALRDADLFPGDDGCWKWRRSTVPPERTRRTRSARSSRA